MNHALGPAQQQPASSELAAALGACRRAFVATAVFSGMSNILMLTGAVSGRVHPEAGRRYQQKCGANYDAT
jgi:hypothetical protein